ncbi:MAG TPA: hypothetical protein VHO72_12480 [Bacteroidales bacterium]|nr:hypothetical protein [Bacteroidales bacterium]
MSKKNVNPSNKEKPRQDINKPKSTATPKDLLDIVDQFFDKRAAMFFYISLVLTVLFSLLLFDVKVGIGGDDSTYILRAYEFIKEGVYPGYQGPLYPMFLGPFIGLFGIHIAFLKLLSFVFTILAVIFTFKAFKKVVPAGIHIPTLILISINYFVLYFASQTYSEALFFFLQSMFFWYFIKHFVDKEQSPSHKNFMVLGFLLFLLAITRNIGLVAIMAVLAYFIIKKQWKYALLSLIGFAVFFLGFEFIKRIFWDSASLQIAGQGSSLMNKSFYDPSKGKEDLAGFIGRLIGNSNLYFSKHVFSFVGLRPEITVPAPFLTIIVWGLLILAFFKTFQRNQSLFFVSIYAIGTSAAIFLVTQTTWDQWRLIINLFPVILLLIFGSLYYTFKSKGLSSLQFVFPILLIILFFTSLSRTSTHVKTQKEILAKNLKGNMLYGYTPDWINYIEMSKWVAANTPKDAVTAVRKSTISFIYTNRKFHNISVVPSITTDSLLKRMNDTSVYIGVKMNAFINSKVYASIAIKAVGFVNGNFSFGDSEAGDGSIVGIYEFSKAEFPIWEEQLKKENLYYDANIKNWIKAVPSLTNDYAIYVPEILLDVLHKAKVKYMILASLRSNPYENTGNIITTMHRYVNFIQLKYPESFVLVNTMGTDEIAQLVELKI